MADLVRRKWQWGLLVRLLGAFIGLLGLLLFYWGLDLARLGGSSYYVVAGAGLMVSGLLLVLRRILGGHLYIGVAIATLFWGFWEVGLDYWGLLPRVLVPLLLLIPIFFAIAEISNNRRRWKRAFVASALVGAIPIAATLGLILHDPTYARGELPPEADVMADPSPMRSGEDWPAYGGSYSARRFSPLAQINAGNVQGLRRVWTAHTGDFPGLRYGAETTPLKIGANLYLCSGRNVLISLDAVTGRERWRFDPHVSDKAIPYTAACRGVTYYAVSGQTTDAECRSRIIEGTLDGRLIAVDARNGKLCSGFGKRGMIDIKSNMGMVDPGMVAITSPPTIIRGVIVTGHQVLDGIERWAPSGVIQAYDAVTGELRWAWDMNHPEWTREPPSGQVYSRGTPNMWTIASGDEALGLVYLPMGNASMDYWSGLRSPQENRYSSSLVAIDVLTGKPAWSFQTVHADVWDYDLGAQATLVDYPTRKGSVPALVLPTKQGDIYVLDRRTGKALTGVGTMRAPTGGVEPQRRARTQPVSLFHNVRMPDLTERDMWGVTPLDQLKCRIKFRESRYVGLYTPPEFGRSTIQYPGFNGGIDWGGVSVDERRKIVVINYNDDPNLVELYDNEGRRPPKDVPFAGDVNAGWLLGRTGMPCKRPPYGGIRAIDLRTGAILWDRPLGSSRANGPFGISSHVPIEMGMPNNGGSVVTAGGLIFIAAATDNLIRAIDIRSGKTVWQDVLPAGGQATPMTYSVKGKQYLVIMAGGHHFMRTPIGDAIIAYALN